MTDNNTTLTLATKLSPSAIGYPDDGRELVERYLADEQRDMPAQEKQ